MKYGLLFLFTMLSSTTVSPIIWLHKDPQSIIDGTDDFFFPFLKFLNQDAEENVAIVRNHSAWAQEVLTYFKGKIEEYPTSAYSKNSDPATMRKAQDALRKEYRELEAKLNTKTATPKAARSCTKLSSQDRKRLNGILQKTAPDLFGAAPEKPMLFGIQGPQFGDFQRRAAIEDAYATVQQELDRYNQCPKLSEQDKMSIKKAYEHVRQMYEQVLDTEGLRTAKLMENV